MLYHSPRPSKLFWHYSRVDFMSLSDYLFNSLRLLNLDTRPVHTTQQLWSLIQTEINTACDLYIPKFKASSRKPPKWFTPSIKHSLKKIHSLRRQLKCNPSPYKRSKLSKMESDLKNKMLKAKEHYEYTLISTFRQNAKQLHVYTHLRQLWKTNVIPHTIIHNSMPVQHPAEKAKIFNEYFISVFTRSNYILPPVKDLPTPNTQLSHIAITPGDVFEALVIYNIGVI